MVGILPGCCARAASGHAAAPPPTRVMKSRRLIGRSQAQEHCIGSNECFDRAQTGHQNQCRSAQPMSQMGQKPALPRRSIGVRFALNKQTPTARAQCDAMCQDLTHAPQQDSSSFDHLVGDGEQRRGHLDAEHMGGVDVNEQLELVACTTGKSAGLSPLRMRPA